MFQIQLSKILENASNTVVKTEHILVTDDAFRIPLPAVHCRQTLAANLCPRLNDVPYHHYTEIIDLIPERRVLASNHCRRHCFYLLLISSGCSPSPCSQRRAFPLTFVCAPSNGGFSVRSPHLPLVSCGYHTRTHGNTSRHLLSPKPLPIPLPAPLSSHQSLLPSTLFILPSFPSPPPLPPVSPRP